MNKRIIIWFISIIIRQDFLYGVGKRAWNSGFTGGMGKRGSISLPGPLYTAGGFNFYGELLDDFYFLSFRYNRELGTSTGGKMGILVFYLWYKYVSNKTEAGLISGT